MHQNAAAELTSGCRNDSRNKMKRTETVGENSLNPDQDVWLNCTAIFFHNFPHFNNLTY